MYSYEDRHWSPDLSQVWLVPTMSDCSSDSDDRDPALYPTPAQRSARTNLRRSLQGHRLVPCVYRLIGWMYTSTEMHRDDETWKELNAQTHRILDEV
jgi:hypothetical protein